VGIVQDVEQWAESQLHRCTPGSRQVCHQLVQEEVEQRGTNTKRTRGRMTPGSARQESRGVQDVPVLSAHAEVKVQTLEKPVQMSNLHVSSFRTFFKNR